MNSTKSSNNKSIYIVYGLLLILSFLFLAVFSFSTSPVFFREYGVDSLVYMIMGKLSYTGKTPYLDFFDHKGPLLILIQYVGQLISPNDIRNGIFFIQVCNLFISLILIFKCSRYYLSATNSLLIVLLSLIAFSRFISGGNLTEEYSLPFSFLTLLYVIKYLRLDTPPDKKQFLIIGICAAMTFWVRVNNAAVITACFMFIIINETIYRNWKLVVQAILYCSTGFALITLPILVYFWKADALYEMWDAAFLSNFEYLLNADKHLKNSLYNDWRISDHIKYFLYSKTPLILLGIGSISYYFFKKEKNVLLLAFLLVLICYLSTQTGYPFIHYTMVTLPCFVLGTIYIWNTIITKYDPRKLLSISFIFLSTIILVILSAITLKKTFSMRKYQDKYISEIIHITNSIPEEDYNNVYIYNVQLEIFLITDILPYTRNFIYPEWHAKVLNNNRMIEDTNRMMLENPPKWVVSEGSEESYNKEFFYILDNNYLLYKKTDSLLLYQHKTEK